MTPMTIVSLRGDGQQFSLTMSCELYFLLLEASSHTPICANSQYELRTSKVQSS